MAKEYIERNALIAEYDRVHIGAPGGARRLMVDAPTADVVEVKRGKWVLHHPDGSATCSVCGRKQKDVWDFDNWQNYCGHCGADMRGDEK